MGGGNIQPKTQEPEFDIESLCSCEQLYWFDCYKSDNRYKKLITPNSFSHPAKASFGLIERIYKHLENLELLKPGDSIIDFMCGTFRIPLVAALKGYNTIGVELEDNFVAMSKDNIAQAEKITGKKLSAKVLKGDARKLSELLEHGGVGVVSPPFMDALQTGKMTEDGFRKFYRENYQRLGRSGSKVDEDGWVKSWLKHTSGHKYGDTEGQIGNLLDKPSKVGVVSPPYEQVMERNKPDHPNILNADPEMKKLREGQLTYGSSPAQIGNLKDEPSKVGIISPPYGDVMADQGHDPEKDKVYLEKGIFKNNYNPDNKDNIGNLSDKESLVGFISPPYEKSLNDGVGGREDWREHYEEWGRAGASVGNRYSSDVDNIGNQTQETYTSAMLKCYQEAFKAGISPLIVITKNPTRAGKLRRLDLSTLDMVIKAGYIPIDFHRAVLFKIAKNATLDGSKEAETYKGRLSFFKRLSLGNGNITAQWEDILITVSPNGNFGKVGAVSPPYNDSVEGHHYESAQKRVLEGRYKGKRPDVFLSKTNIAAQGAFNGYSDNPNNIGNLKDEIPTSSKEIAEQERFSGLAEPSIATELRKSKEEPKP